MNKTTTQNERGEWVNAVPEPYYATLADKIRCFLGRHVWFYGQQGMLRYMYCVSCNKVIYPIGEETKE